MAKAVATATDAPSEKPMSINESATSCRTRLLFASIFSFMVLVPFLFVLFLGRTVLGPGFMSWSQTPDRVGLTPGK